MAEHEVRLPKFGMQMVEATIVAWIARDGEAVSEGEDIATIATDKVDADIEAPAAGVIKILVTEGETVPVGALLAVISS